MGGKGTPSFFAAMQTFNGPDTATLRVRGLNMNGCKVHVEEEKSRDNERKHTNENVGYMALWDGCFEDWGWLLLELPDQTSSVLKDKIQENQQNAIKNV